MWFLGKKEHFCGEIITFGWWMITFDEGPLSACGQILLKNPGRGQTPPIQAMPGFWERMVRQPMPTSCLEPTRLIHSCNSSTKTTQQCHDICSEIVEKIYFNVQCTLCSHTSSITTTDTVRSSEWVKDDYWCKKSFLMYLLIKWNDGILMFSGRGKDKKSTPKPTRQRPPPRSKFRSWRCNIVAASFCWN